MTSRYAVHLPKHCHNRLSLYREAAKEAESIIDRWEDELDEDEDYEPDEYFSD